MKYLKRFIEKSKYDDIEEMVKLYIVDLIDRGYDVKTSLKEESTWMDLEILISAPTDDSYYLWEDAKDDIIRLVKVIKDEFSITQIEIRLWQGPSIYIDDYNELENIDNEDNYEILDTVEFRDITLYIIENK